MNSKNKIYGVFLKITKKTFFLAISITAISCVSASPFSDARMQNSFLVGKDIKSHNSLIQGTKKTAVFWIETNDNDLLSRQVVQFVAKRGSIVVLRSPIAGINNGPDYKQVVNKFHQFNPSIPVLAYQWATKIKTDNTIESHTFKDFNNPKSLLNHTRGTLLGERRGTVYSDITQSSFQSWLSSKVQSTLSEVSSDGVAFDLTFRMAAPTLNRSLCKTEPGFCVKYGSAMDTILSKIKQTINPKLLIYNGIWNGEPNIDFNEQVKLLEYTDGAAIEYFGMRPKPEKSSFEQHILPYIQLAKSKPDKILLFFGRGPWRYNDYQEDYLWQRYLYSCYLLGATPNTYFKYHNSFQVPPHAGRSGGLDYYSDWDINLGNPLSEYIVKDGLYIRPFRNGLVIVSPHDGFERKYTLSQPLFTPEGKKISGQLKLSPGEGHILLNSILPPAKSLKLTFDEQPNVFSDLKQGSIKMETNKNKYLHLQALQTNEEARHDLLLDGVRKLTTFSQLSIKVRTKDPNAKLLLVAEVNDPSRKAMESGINITTSQIPVPKGLLETLPFAFRLNNGRAKPLSFISQKKLSTSGSWQTLIFKGDELNPKYSIKRWKYIRLIGNLDLDEIEVY